MNKNICVVIFIFLILSSCSKSKDNHVAIRVHNNTRDYFTSVIVNSKSFTDINPFTTSDYKVFNQVSDLPIAQLINAANDTLYAGYLYYDPSFTFLSEGKYTLKIYKDTSTNDGFNCQYIKDE